MACDITFEPADSKDFNVTEQSTQVLLYNITCSEAANRTVRIDVADTSIAEVFPTAFWDTMLGGGETNAYAANVSGIAFGRTTLSFYIGGGGEDVMDEVLYEVAVFRKPTSINLVFQIVLGVMILLYNFGFGCKVDHEQIKGILRRPVAPAIGACCQFLIMAPLSFGIAMALSLDNIAGIGLLAIGCSPGGGGSNVFAYLLNADLELSITLTFISTILALGMTPFWMWALGRFFYGDNPHLRIPVINVFSSLAIVVIPVAGGVLLRHCKRKVADKFAWTLKPMTGLMAVVFLGLGIYVYYYALIRIEWRLLVACTIVPFCGYCIGFGAGIAGKQTKKRAVTIALETGFQNLALALFMIQTSLTPPESDFAGVVPICYSFISAAFPALAFIILHAFRMVRGCLGHNDNHDLDNGDGDEFKEVEGDTTNISIISNSVE